MSTSSTTAFTPEGGKYHLAEALFTRFRFRIRCPTCPGLAGAPGFIKDQAGKSPKDGLSRRMWKCQQSNARSAATTCPRQTCTQYILLAQQHGLTPSEFIDVVQAVVQQDRPPAEVEALATYLLPSTVRSSTTHDPLPITSPERTQPKRKAWEELPNPRVHHPPSRLEWAKPSEGSVRPPVLPSINKGRESTTDVAQVTRWLQQAITQAEGQQQLLHQVLHTLTPPAPTTTTPISCSQPLPSSSPAELIPSSPMQRCVTSKTTATIDGLAPQWELPDLVTRFCQPLTPRDRSQIRKQVKAQGCKRAFEAQLQQQRKPRPNPRPPTHHPLPFTPNPKGQIPETPPTSSPAWSG